MKEPFLSSLCSKATPYKRSRENNRRESTAEPKGQYCHAKRLPLHCPESLQPVQRFLALQAAGI